MRDKLAIKNGSITLICQFVDIILGFIVRKAFITYIGIEMLGVNGTFTSLLNTLSLAELGFESAVIYSLYRPIIDKNTDEIEKIVSILKMIYAAVGVFILIGGVVLSLFLPSILSGVEINHTIYIVFYLQLVSNVVTYFLAYKKSFLLAMQKDYVRNIFTSIYKVVATICQIILILTFHSYVLYVTVSIIQNFATNLTVSIYVDKKYNYRFDRKIDMNIFRRIITDVKDIFFSKIAGYVYSSTDNLIISACVSTASVGLLGNYTQILYQIKTVISNVFASTKPIIGNFLTAETDKNHSFQILKDYTFIRYSVAVALLVPGFVLCNCFISAWLGSEYILPTVIPLLLVSDIFIHFVHGALVDYIAGLGYFKADRKISIVGAIINLTVSFILVQYIGLAGVLVGTVISQAYFWINRSLCVFKDYFQDKRKLLRYWVLCVCYILVFYILCILCCTLFQFLPLDDSYIKFIVGGISCYVIILPVYLICFARTGEFKYLRHMIQKQTGRLIK